MESKSTIKWIFIYSLNYLVWHIGIIFLDWEIANRLLVADVLDMLTPYIMTLLALKIYWLLDPGSGEIFKSKASTGALFLLVIGSITFIEGHGIHLSGNAIARHLHGAPGTSLYNLTYFFDEILGHILWDSGLILTSFALILRAIEKPFSANRKSPLLIVSSLFYGFTYFCNAIEGQTVIFALPVAMILPPALYVFHKHTGTRAHPIVVFFASAYFFALLLFIVWVIWQNGFPQFSELGWI